MSSSVLLPLLICAALGLPIFALVWRVFVVGGELRREAQHARAARDIARRADLSLGELSEVVDELRRRKASPESIAASMTASTEALGRYAAEAEVVDKHAARDGHAEIGSLKAEIERAQRAVDLIEHGRERMLEGVVEGVAEGETEVKRGYLNLLHAREAIRERGDQIAAASATPPGTDPRWRIRRR